MMTESHNIRNMPFGVYSGGIKKEDICSVLVQYLPRLCVGLWAGNWYLGIWVGRVLVVSLE